MSCERVRPELTGFHFGVVDDVTREDVELHLTGCPACLGEFLAIKRAVETSSTEPAPSELSRARLRRAVAAELGRSTRRAWWERPVAFGVAAASLLLALGAVHAVASAPGAAPHGRVAASSPP